MTDKTKNNLDTTTKLHYGSSQVDVEAVPNEISLIVSVSGCDLACKGCHSPETWNHTYGKPLTLEVLAELVKKNKHITCVCFYGGTWKGTQMIPLFKAIKSLGLKVAQYTGWDKPDMEYKNHLDYWKIGRWDEELGGLRNPSTNQKMYKITNGIMVHIPMNR